MHKVGAKIMLYILINANENVGGKLFQVLFFAAALDFPVNEWSCGRSRNDSHVSVFPHEAHHWE